MSTLKEKRKGLINKVANLSLLVTVDEKVEEREIAWCEYTFITTTGEYSINTLYCPESHDYSINHAIKKVDLPNKSKVTSVDVRRIKNIGYCVHKQKEAIEIWKTRE